MHKFTILAEVLAEELKFMFPSKRTPRWSRPEWGMVGLAHEHDGTGACLSRSDGDNVVRFNGIAPSAKQMKLETVWAYGTELQDAVKAMSGETITVTVTEKMLKLESEGTETEVTRLPRPDGDYEITPPPGGVTVDAELLWRALHAVVPHAATQESRYAINGVFLEYKDSILTVVGTNTRRLAAVKLKASRAPMFSAIVPLGAVGWLKQLSDQQEGTVLLYHTPPKLDEKGSPIDSGALTAVSNGMGWSGRCLEGTYPKWREAVPSKSKATMIFNRTELAAKLKTFKYDADHATVYSFSKLKVVARHGLAGQKFITDLTSTMHKHSRGENVEVAFNTAYLLDALNSAAPATWVTIEVSDACSPLKLTARIPAGEDLQLTAVVMPVRV